MRRLLENGANSSFVNQIVDETIVPEDIARDPIEAARKISPVNSNPNIPAPESIFGEGRLNAKGWDITDPPTLARIEAEREGFRTRTWDAGPMIAGDVTGGEVREVRNPADPTDLVGHVTYATPEDVANAIAIGQDGFREWSARPVAERGRVSEADRRSLRTECAGTVRPCRARGGKDYARLRRGSP